MWGRDFIPPPAFEPAFFGLSPDAGRKPGGRPKGLTPLLSRAPVGYWLASAILVTFMLALSAFCASGIGQPISLPRPGRFVIKFMA
jgi:hypothetical protein